MRAEAPAWMRRVTASSAIAPGLIASLLLAAAIAAGCRTAGAGGKVERDPALTGVVRPAEAAEIAALPEGPGKTLISERCLLCHSAALITQQRKDAAAWGRTVTQMRTWGTPIQDEDQAALVAYLAAQFGQAGAQR